MKWNRRAGECQVREQPSIVKDSRCNLPQIYLDVDCSSITYTSRPSAPVLAAVEKAQEELAVQEELAALEELSALEELAEQEELLGQEEMMALEEPTRQMNGYRYY